MKKVAYSKNKKYTYDGNDIENISSYNDKLDKNKLLKVDRLLMFNKKENRIVFETSAVYPQHFYPLSILDYANAMKEMLVNNSDELPILSVSSKDYPYCDFRCKDCLANPTRKWAIDNFIESEIELEKYKKILKQIALFSKKRGVDSVRFEMCGEGNPDLYRYRSEIIKYAKEECNMGIVYISTGSKMDSKLKEALVKYASYIRISLPGITNEAYDFYSDQPSKEKFTFDDAMNLLKDLTKLRKEYNRENELLIGVRTCMRKYNNGHYISLAKKLGEMDVDSFQIVKVLTDNYDIIVKNSLDETTRNDIIELKKSYKKYGIKHLQIPNVLDKLYIDRSLNKNKKPARCYSSMISPILYSSNLIVCIHWDKIKDIENFHYGKLNGSENEIEEIMYGEKGNSIREKIPHSCNNCCALGDNLLLEAIRSQLSLYNNLEDIEFLVELKED